MTKKQIIAKYEPVIDEYLHHRQKAIKRRREIELQKLDNEWESRLTLPIEIPSINNKGYYRREKERQTKYEKWAWRALWVLCGLVLLVGIFCY